MEINDNSPIVPAGFNKFKDFSESLRQGTWERPDMDHLIAEMQMAVLGDFQPLQFKINTHQLNQELEKYESKWVDYLPRADRVNNRKGLCLTTLPGWSYDTMPSLAEAVHRTGRPLKDMDFSEKTELYHDCKSLHQVLNLFPTLGRTFFVRANMGGYFVPHRDQPQINRDVFRLIAFVRNCGPFEYDFMIDHDKMQIEEGRVYLVNTRRMHRTISYVDNSTHLIMNVPVTLENSLKVLSNLQHRH